MTDSITPEPAHVTRDRFWRDWIALWNGAYELAPEIIAPEFQIHAVIVNSERLENAAGADRLVRWISQNALAFTGLTFTTTVGPIADDTFITGQWLATGTYVGGMPGNAVPPGSAVTFSGTDILRLANGKATDYWVTSDIDGLFTRPSAGADS